jgi:hypothetical protein
MLGDRNQIPAECLLGCDCCQDTDFLEIWLTACFHSETLGLINLIMESANLPRDSVVERRYRLNKSRSAAVCDHFLNALSRQNRDCYVDRAGKVPVKVVNAMLYVRTES